MNYLVLIPTIIELIKSIEILLPQSSGKDKLAAVIAAVANIAGEASDIAPKLTPLISAIVAGLNILGIFKKKAVTI